jgi:hypothetical protein
MLNRAVSCVLFAGWLAGCSSGSDSPGSDSPGSDSPGSDSPGSDSPGSDSPGSDSPGSSSSEPVNGSSVEPTQGSDVDPEGATPRRVRGADGVEVQYQFVDTSSGMTIEAVSGDQVQTLSCPTRTCAGYCDECAARACEASGELAEACQRLVNDCSQSCTCNNSGAGQPSNCGFPVCATNRNLCYIGAADPSGVDLPLPSDPAPDPASRPSSANGASSNAGSNATPLPG